MSLTNDQNKALALSGLFECCVLVDSIARNGSCDHDAQNVLIESLFNTNPNDAQDIYSNLHALKKGQQALLGCLGESGIDANPQVLRYALALLHLQQKLSKQNDMLSLIGNKLELASNQVSHFGIDHENVIANLASTYQESISTFNMRIQVSGHARHLQVEHNAAKIRALLLAGIRSATLWRQLGGHRWQFLFGKGKIRKAAKSLDSILI